MTLIQREIDNPDWTPDRDGEKAFPRTITAQVQTRDCSYLTMYARNQIDTAQLAACEKFHAYFHLSGQSGAVAIDYEVQKVDGGKVTDGLPAARMDALAALDAVSGELGSVDYELVRRFAGSGQSIGFIAEHLTGKIPSKDDRLYCGRRIKDALDVLCRMWKLKS